MSSQDQGSFTSGFALGLFAGAAGYFFFGTDKGKAARQQIQAEWESAKEELVEQGAISSTDVTIRDIARQIFAKMVGPEWLATEAEEKTKKNKSATKAKSTSKEKKFKGTK